MLAAALGPWVIWGIRQNVLIPRWQHYFTVLLLAAVLLTAPFGTTILGSLALRDIRHSRGRMVGLPLALADALFFPLLLLDGFFAALVALLVPNLARLAFNSTHSDVLVNVVMFAGYATGLVLLVGVDFLIVRSAWRAAKRPVVGPTRADSG